MFLNPYLGEDLVVKRKDPIPFLVTLPEDDCFFKNH